MELLKKALIKTITNHSEVYANLFKILSKTVHLIDLSRKSLFNEFVEKMG